jgi:uncharacterized protein YdeI (YjbR/CyaY-like superfamily)
MPKGDGSHYIVINQAIRDKAAVKAGDLVNLELDWDMALRRIEIPAELSQAFSQNPQTETFFEGLSYSHRKEYVDYIKEAKKTETRSRRIEKTLAMADFTSK